MMAQFVPYKRYMQRVTKLGNDPAKCISALFALRDQQVKVADSINEAIRGMVGKFGLTQLVFGSSGELNPIRTVPVSGSPRGQFALPLM